jgi:hypothetical protein
MIGVKRIVAAGRIRLVQANMSQNTLIVYTRGDIQRCTTYMIQTWLSRLSALSFAIDLNSARSALKARPQRACKTTSVSVHADVQWCSAWSQTQLDRCKGLTHEHMHDQCTNASANERGSRSMYLSASITFSTRITAYKSKGLPIDAPYNFYYFFIHAFHYA